MPSSITTLSLLQRTALVINENYGSPAWMLALETGSTPTLTANAGLTQLMNDEIQFLYRRVFGLQSELTASYASAQWNEAYDAFTPAGDGTSGGTVLTGAKLWWPRGASVGGVALPYIAESSLKVSYPDYRTTTGVPAYWYRRDALYVGVYPVPTTTTTITVDGLVIPAPMTADGSGSIGWCTPPQDEMIVDGTALRAILKVLGEDPTKEPKMGALMARYGANLMQFWSELPLNLREGKDAPYKVPPVAVGGK